MTEAAGATLNEVGPPIYAVRGAQPRPMPGDRGTRSSWRGSLVLAAVMFGWMIFAFALAAIASSNDPNTEVPVTVGRGVIVTPADGWCSASDVWDVGPDAISLQSSGVYVAFTVVEYAGSNEELLAEWLEYLAKDFESFRVLPASPVTVAGGLPGLATFASGSSEHWGPENELAVTTHKGTGVVMMATAPAGQLARVQDDLDTMLDTMAVPR